MTGILCDSGHLRTCGIVDVVYIIVCKYIIYYKYFSASNNPEFISVLYMKAFKNGEEDPMDNDNLRELLMRIRDRDKEAFTELYMMMRGCVYGLAFSYTGSHSDAEDILQNTFLKVWNKADTCTGKNVKSWIMMIARNLSYDSRKQTGRSAELSEEIAAPDSISGIFESESVKSMFSCLDEEEREIVVLYSYGFSHREIASVVKRPYATVRWKYSNAIKKLKRNSGGDADE